MNIRGLVRALFSPTGRPYLFAWSQTQRLRKRIGLPMQPKRCCRTEANLGPAQIASPDGRTTMRRCAVCQCRHFERTVDPGRLGVQLSG